MFLIFIFALFIVASQSAVVGSNEEAFFDSHIEIFSLETLDILTNDDVKGRYERGIFRDELKEETKKGARRGLRVLEVIGGPLAAVGVKLAPATGGASLVGAGAVAGGTLAIASAGGAAKGAIEGLYKKYH